MTVKDYLEKMIKNYDKILHYYYTTDDDKYYITDKALEAEFNLPMGECDGEGHRDIERADIYTRVCLLDRLYSTRLQQNPTKSKDDKDNKKHTIDVYAMMNRIFDNRKKLNQLIEEGDVQAVEIIRGKDSDKYNDAYSFATKFCSFSNEEAFPMFDGFVINMLKGCVGSNGFNDKCFDEVRNVKMSNLEKDYAAFKKVHEAFQKYLHKKTNSKSLSCKYTDKFLWLCGKHYGKEDAESFFES